MRVARICPNYEKFTRSHVAGQTCAHIAILSSPATEHETPSVITMARRSVMDYEIAVRLLRVGR